MSPNDEAMIVLIGFILFVVLVLQAIKNRLRMRAERMYEKAEEWREKAHLEKTRELQRKRHKIMEDIANMVREAKNKNEGKAVRAPVQTPKRTSCANCGAPYDGDGAFCGYCGTPKEA